MTWFTLSLLKTESLQTPHPDVLITTPRGQQRVAKVEGDVRDLRRSAPQSGEKAPVAHRPQLHQVVVRTRHHEPGGGVI